jgi:hypothetical protein
MYAMTCLSPPEHDKHLVQQSILSPGSKGTPALIVDLDAAGLWGPSGVRWLVVLLSMIRCRRVALMTIVIIIMIITMIMIIRVILGCIRT